MKKTRDIKFIIYQSLYILVICIIAIKGANLDLVEVTSRENVVDKTVADSIKRVLDSLLALGLKPEFTFDTSKFTQVEKQQYAEFLKNQSTQKIDISNYIPKSELDKYELKKDVPEKKDETTPPEIVVGSLNLVQYHVNEINNKGDAPISIKGVNIAPHTTGSVQLGGESVVTISSGNISKNIDVKENQKPKVNLHAIVPLSGDNISLRELESTTGYRVTIEDDYANQLDYKITGPVVFKEVERNDHEIVLDVRLNFLSSKAQFDTYTDNHPNQDVYTVTFNVNVKDRIAPHNLSQLGVFKFTEW